MAVETMVDSQGCLVDLHVSTPKARNQGVDVLALEQGDLLGAPIP